MAEEQAFAPESWRYDMPAMGAPPADWQRGSGSQLDEGFGNAIKALGGAGAESEDLIRRRNAELGPARERYRGAAEEMNTAVSGAIDRYRTQRQDIPKQPNMIATMSQDMQQWFMISAALGALAGAFTRKPMTSALTAFTGAIQGFKEGNMQKFQMQLQQWKANADLARENNENLLKEMELVFKAKKLNLDTQMAEIEIIGSKYQDEALMNAARQKNATLVANYFFQLKQLQQQHEEHTEKLQVEIAKFTAGLQSKTTRFGTIEGMQQFTNEQQKLQLMLKQTKDPKQRKAIQDRIKMNEWYMKMSTTDPTGELHRQPMPGQEQDEEEEKPGFFSRLFGGGKAGEETAVEGAAPTAPALPKQRPSLDVYGNEVPAGTPGSRLAEPPPQWPVGKGLLGETLSVPRPGEKGSSPLRPMLMPRTLETLIPGAWYQTPKGVGRFKGNDANGNPEFETPDEVKKAPSASKLYQGTVNQEPAEMGT